jgi:Domain of unknown function (DUF5710)
LEPFIIRHNYQCIARRSNASECEKEKPMTSTPTRVVLSVPFVEKDQAKALGARWDRESKQWWIPSTIDVAPFFRWLTPQKQSEPLYRDLAAMDREELEEYGTGHLLEVVFVPWTCWKCKQTTLAFHGAADRALSVTALLYQAKVLEELDIIRKEMGLGAFGCIKPRFSRTIGSAYVSQGCRHCDALIGENPLWEGFNEVFSTVNMSTYPYRKTLSWALLTGMEG